MFLIPAANLLWIIVFLSDYSNVWVQPEVNGWRGYLAGMRGAWNTIRAAMNWEVFEAAPRLTRPLSSLLEAVDFMIRGALWRLMPPHPTLSVTWLFTLLVIPLVLYGVLRSLRIKPLLALGGVALYLANPGTLSMLVMGFRPGKAMVSAALVIMLYWASRLENVSFRRVAPLYVFLLVSLFWDETALILWPALAFLYPRVVFANRSSVGAFLSIPLVYGYSIRWALPAIYAAAGFPLSAGASYYPQRRFNALVKIPPHLDAYFLLLSDIPHKARIAVLDCLGLIDPRLPASGVYFALCGAIVLCLAVLGVLLTRQALRQPWKAPEDRPGLSLVVRSAGLLAVAVLFHVMMMNSVGQGSWGVYWYGAFLVIPFVIAVCALFEYLRVHSLFAAGFVLLVSAAVFYIFPFTNNAYRRFHYYPYGASLLHGVFDNTINRFNLPGPMASGTEMLQHTRNLSGHGGNVTAIGVPVELLYVLYEQGNFGVIEGGQPCRFQHAMFDFTRSPQGAGINCREPAASLADVAEFVGTWRSSSLISVAPNTGYVVMDQNEATQPATGDGARIELPGRKTAARLSSDNQTLIWEDGVVWKRLGNASARTVEGKWTFEGVHTIRKARTGDVLITPSGHAAEAGLVQPGGAAFAPRNGGTGALSAERDTIFWTDAGPWRREQ